jgi:hypothetical protein
MGFPARSRFFLSYRSWFESVFKDKYEYVREWDLMSIAFRLDLGFYYLVIVSQPLKSSIAIPFLSI